MTTLSASVLAPHDRVLDGALPRPGGSLRRWLRAGLGFVGSTVLAVVLLVVVSL